ncbi:hypothetical protein NUITMVS3_40830 [Shewanella xiamenensis]|nr:hypothetical protein NUITMVS2_09970 [Shewanella xiamenensis]GLD79647.1 hypothetical protein NUITMVS3_40830 [Shewanella xiamenensis]
MLAEEVPAAKAALVSANDVDSTAAIAVKLNAHSITLAQSPKTDINKRLAKVATTLQSGVAI